MRAIAGAALLEALEAGQHLGPVGRALALLAAALPDAPRAELARLSIGRRDALLLDAYRLTFGQRLDVLADCPACREPLEIALRADDLRAAAPAAPDLSLSAAGYAVRFRLPDSEDLAAASHAPDLAAARTALLRHCLLDIHGPEGPADAPDLPPEVATAVAEQMAACDPQADLRLRMSCPACGHSWLALFDIGEILWQRARAAGRDLLGSVHALARAYGWREADILAMSEVRRRWYLDMLG